MDIQKMTVEHVVIGSGAAGFQAALRLKQNGEEDVVLLTEKISSGTSRNTVQISKRIISCPWPARIWIRLGLWRRICLPVNV